MKNTLIYSAAALIATSAAANAQSIDYQVMGEMFGEPVTTGATGAPPLHSPAGGRDWPKGGMFGGMCDNVHGAVYANGESTRIAARRSGMG